MDPYASQALAQSLPTQEFSGQQRPMYNQPVAGQLLQDAEVSQSLQQVRCMPLQMLCQHDASAEDLEEDGRLRADIGGMHAQGSLAQSGMPAGADSLAYQPQPEEPTQASLAEVAEMQAMEEAMEPANVRTHPITSPYHPYP